MKQLLLLYISTTTSVHKNKLLLLLLFDVHVIPHHINQVSMVQQLKQIFFMLNTTIIYNTFVSCV